MNSPADQIPIVRQLLQDIEGYELDQLSWRVNDGLREQGIDPVPVYVELMQQGELWFLSPLQYLGTEAVLRALPELLNVRFKGGHLHDFRRLLSDLGAASVPALLAAATGGTAEVRYFAFDTLGDLGPEAQAAIPTLIQILQDPEQDITALWTVADVLARIGVASPEVLSALSAAAARPDADPDYNPMADALAELQSPDRD